MNNIKYVFKEKSKEKLKENFNDINFSIGLSDIIRFKEEYDNFIRRLGYLINIDKYITDEKKRNIISMLCSYQISYRLKGLKKCKKYIELKEVK